MSIKITVEETRDDSRRSFIIEDDNVDMDIWEFTDEMIRPLYYALGYGDTSIKEIFMAD